MLSFLAPSAPVSRCCFAHCLKSSMDTLFSDSICTRPSDNTHIHSLGFGLIFLQWPGDVVRASDSQWTGRQFNSCSVCCHVTTLDKLLTQMPLRTFAISQRTPILCGCKVTASLAESNDSPLLLTAWRLKSALVL